MLKVLALIFCTSALNIISNVKHVLEETNYKILGRPKEDVTSNKTERFNLNLKKLFDSKSTSNLKTSSTTTTSTTKSTRTSSEPVQKKIVDVDANEYDSIISKHAKTRADPRLVPSIVYELDCRPGVLFHECTQECMAATERKTYEEAQKFTSCIEICRDAYLLETVEGCLLEDGGMVPISKDPVKYSETNARMRAVRYRLGRNMNAVLSCIFYLLLCLVAVGIVVSVKTGVVHRMVESLVGNDTGRNIKNAILPVSEPLLPVAEWVFDRIVAVVDFIKDLTGMSTEDKNEGEVKSQELLKTLESYEEIPQKR